MANDPGYGFLFPAKDKSGNKPSMSGLLTLLDGSEVQIAGWSRTSKAGKKYLSLKITLPQEAAPETADDDIPL